MQSTSDVEAQIYLQVQEASSRPPHVTATPRRHGVHEAQEVPPSQVFIYSSIPTIYRRIKRTEQASRGMAATNNWKSMMK